MGMFDELFVSPEVLPSTEKWMTENTRWQTKSLDCLLDNFKINKNGRFLKYDTKFEETPSDELPYPEMPFIGAWREVDGQGKFNIYLYTGTIYFYTSSPNNTKIREKSVWWEYKAEFYNGTMIAISRIKDAGL